LGTWFWAQLGGGDVGRISIPLAGRLIRFVSAGKGYIGVYREARKGNRDSEQEEAGRRG